MSARRRSKTYIGIPVWIFFLAFFVLGVWCGAHL